MEDINQIQHFIKSISQIDETELNDFCSNREIKTIKKGEIVARENKIADKLYFLHKGIFRYYLISSDGKDITKEYTLRL